MKRSINSSKALIAFMIFIIISIIFVGCTTLDEKKVVPPQYSVSKQNEGSEDGFNETIVDSTGTTITLTAKPERIVSLAPSITEILYYLGEEENIVGRTDYCNFPETIKDIPSVGGTANPNIETIVSLEPDLVIGATHVSEETINKLRELGMNVAFLNEKENIDGTYSTIGKIGRLIGREVESIDVVIEMQNKIDEITKKVAALNKTQKPKVYYMVGYGEQDFTAGGDTFIGQIIELAGGENIAKGIDGWSISREYIIENEPDIIIAPSDLVTLTKLQQTEFYKDLKAVKEGQVYNINGDIISRQGPRTADAVIEMAKIINPELAK